MPEDNKNENENGNQDPPELVLDEVVEVKPDELSDEQTTYLQENADELSDEQKETFKDVLKKGGEEEDDDPEDIDPESRTTPPTKKKKDGEEEEEEVDPEDKARIDKIVDDKLKAAGVGDTRDQMELDAVIRENPELSKHRANALKYMKAHPSLVARDAMRIVSADDQQRLGAEKERKAAEKAKNTRGGGNSARQPKGAGKDWGAASPEEVADKKAEILNRRQ